MINCRSWFHRQPSWYSAPVDVTPAKYPGTCAFVKLSSRCAPSASADPYGLRRTAYGLVETLIGAGMDVDVREAMAAAAAGQPIEVTEAALGEAAAFVRRRLEQLMIDRGADVELVRAVLASQGDRPAAAMRAVGELSPLLGGDTLAELIAAVARPVRILRSQEPAADWGAVDEAL